MVFCGVVAAAVFVPEDSEYYNPILYPVKWTVKKLFVGETDILYTDFMRMTAETLCEFNGNLKAQALLAGAIEEAKQNGFVFDVKSDNTRNLFNFIGKICAKKNSKFIKLPKEEQIFIVSNIINYIKVSYDAGSL